MQVLFQDTFHEDEQPQDPPCQPDDKEQGIRILQQREQSGRNGIDGHKQAEPPQYASIQVEHSVQTDEQIGKAEQQPGSSCIIFAAYQQDHKSDDGKSPSEEIQHRKGFSNYFYEPTNPKDGKYIPNIQ